MPWGVVIQTAAVSCSPVPYLFGGVGMVSGMTGQLGRAWVVHGVGAWHVHGGGDVGDDVVGWGKCMCILPTI